MFGAIHLISSVVAIVITSTFYKIMIFIRRSRQLRNELSKKHKQLHLNRNKAHDRIKHKAATMKPSIQWDQIILLPAHKLNELALSGQLSCSEILTAFQLRCIEFESMNFLAEYIDKADEIAKSLDNRRNEFQNSSLYGVPISLKECLSVEGLDATCGLVKYCNKPQTSNCVIYDVLVSKGAIPFITTSMARAGMSHDSSNPIFGEQHNPRYKGFTAGGSSGGEGIALSLDASPLGVGTDIGGSVRFPPAFNGVCGLNPSRKRISSKGIFKVGSVPRLDLVVTIGPMARCIDDLTLFMRAVLDDTMFQKDPFLIPLSFNNHLYNRQNSDLRVGYFTSFMDSSVAQSVPSVKRAVTEAVSVLQAAGFQASEFLVPKPSYAFTLVLRSMLHDSGYALSQLLLYEPIPFIKQIQFLLLSLPRVCRTFLSNIFYKRFGEPALPMVTALKGLKSGIEAASLLGEIDQYRIEFMAATAEYDIILCPLFPIPIPRKHEDDTINNISSIYSILWNLLDLPTGVVCTSRVTEKDNELAAIIAKELENDGNHFNAYLHRVQTVTELPLSVQVVARPYREENVLRVLKILESASTFDRKTVQIRSDLCSKKN